MNVLKMSLGFIFVHDPVNIPKIREVLDSHVKPAAAKAGVMALTRCAALEATEFNVRINAVAPSIVLHPMLRKSASEELLAELESKEAYGRAAEAWEVANVMMFLASDYSSYMTGEILPVSSQRA